MLIETSAVIGFGGLLVTLIGGIIARDRALTNMIHQNNEETTKSIKEGDDVLHERINRTRDEMNNGYVRRADLDGHLQRIEASLKELKADAKEDRKETNARLDAVLAAVRKP